MGCGDTAVASNENERRQFIRKLLAAKDDIVAFVNQTLGWKGVGQYHHWLKGSFNIGYVIERSSSGEDDGGPRAVFIRFPIAGPSYSPWGAEKVKNEAMVIAYLREHTTIPLPRVYLWGAADECPRQLAPFILMDYMDGVCLDDLLKKPTISDQDPLILNPDIDTSKLQFVYSQIADYMLQLSRLRFSRIGAISNDSGTWAVTRRPLTYDMNELAAYAKFPSDKLPSAPFNRSMEYFSQRAEELREAFSIQQNVQGATEEGSSSAAARRRLEELIPKYTVVEDEGPSFKLFGDDFGPFNMLADPDTFRITAVIDWEFTNTMPAQYFDDIPSWLLLASPHCWLERDDKDGFERLFVPQMQLFLKELERAEASQFPLTDGQEDNRKSTRPFPSLSTSMRESWESGRFWFNYAMRTSADADLVYWKALSRTTE